MPRLVSPIYDMGPSSTPIGADADRRNDEARQAIWRKLGVLVIDPEDVNDDWLRQALINEAQRRYGRRGRADQ